MEDKKDYKAIRYDHFGSVDVLKIEKLPKAIPQSDEILVRVKTAGINPGEASIREGLLEKQFPSKFPSGQGTDFAGIIEKVGAHITNFKTGDEVIGFSFNRNSQAEYVIVKEDQLIFRPPNVSWEIAGGMFVVGTTAYAAVESVSLMKGETVIVSGAAGGVGSLVIQMAKKRGANVIGIASESNHPWLKKHGVIPVSYQKNLQQNLKKALNGNQAVAFIDTSGKGYVEIAIKMGISPKRIDTIIDFQGAAKYKVKSEGSSVAGNAKVLKEIANMVDSGELEIPIAKSYPFTQIKEAFKDLEQHHTHGKIILDVSL